jgi:Cytochrome c oxidase subunit III
MLSGAISLVSYCHHHLVNNLSPVLVFAVIYWWRDVIREAKGGDHTSRVQRGILIGFLLFLLSKVTL